jgi:hypothetical protein
MLLLIVEKMDDRPDATALRGGQLLFGSSRVVLLKSSGYARVRPWSSWRHAARLRRWLLPARASSAWRRSSWIDPPGRDVVG